jgi:hypothetical protein
MAAPVLAWFCKVRTHDTQDHNRETGASGAHVRGIRAGQEPGSGHADRI